MIRDTGINLTNDEDTLLKIEKTARRKIFILNSSRYDIFYSLTTVRPAQFIAHLSKTTPPFFLGTLGDLTFPMRSPLEKGWYGMSLNCSGISHGPHPDGLFCISGGTK